MLSRPLLFLCLFGTRNPASNSSHESMKPRCVLLSMRIISVPADCTRSRFGAGRNRYVSAAPAWNRTPGLAAQKSKSRLSVAANKSCLRGRTSKIWSCAPAPYGKGTHVCAALTGGRIIAAPFFDWPSSGRRSVFHILQEHSGKGTITTSLRRDTRPKFLRFLFYARYSDRNSSGVLHGIGNGSGRRRTVRMSDCRPDIPAIHPVDGVPATVCVRVFS